MEHDADQYLPCHTSTAWCFQKERRSEDVVSRKVRSVSADRFGHAILRSLMYTAGKGKNWMDCSLMVFELHIASRGLCDGCACKVRYD